MAITVRDLIKALKNYDENLKVSFSELEFNHLKQSGDKYVQFHFEQLVYKDANTGHVIIEDLD